MEKEKFVFIVLLNVETPDPNIDLENDETFYQFTVEKVKELCEAIFLHVEGSAEVFYLLIYDEERQEMQRLPFRVYEGAAKDMDKFPFDYDCAELLEILKTNYPSPNGYLELIIAFKSDQSAHWDYNFLKMSEYCANTNLTVMGYDNDMGTFARQMYYEGDFDTGFMVAENTLPYTGEAMMMTKSTHITSDDFQPSAYPDQT